MTSIPKYYFVSDVHLGSNTFRDAAEIESLFHSWLIMVEKSLLAHEGDNKGLFLVGDVFDFWFEYCRCA